MIKGLVFFICVTFLMGVFRQAHADTPMLTINLWPGLAPGEQTLSLGESKLDTISKVTTRTDITCPQLCLYPAADTKHRHPAVIVCPGGGYWLLATDLEGTEIARWLNSLGYTAAVLYYRVPNKREAAFQDVQRAVSLLRANAGTLNIDSQHLGIIGFSAGGHLAARLACGYDQRAYTSVDAVDQVSCRPDFAMLIYPAYLWDKENNRPMPEVQPHSGMPPMFLAQTRDDDFFDAEAYAVSLKKAGAETLCKIYDKGGHGYGLRLSPSLPAHHWPEEAAAWLHQQTGRNSIK